MVTRAPASDAATAATDEFEAYRRELTAYCYRMLGSGFEAEDAVQETMVRAWRGIEQFEGRSALRSWLYRIATNVCLDMRRGPQRRARPMDLGPSSTADAIIGPEVAEHAWVQPIPSSRVLPTNGDPAELASERDSIRLAFVAALQHLPPRQRAVLILREVLRWQATEVAELLDTSVASVNSALQRARATLAKQPVNDIRPEPISDDQRELVARYVDAFERYDIDSLVTLLHDDVVQSMPPFELWMKGPDQVANWMLGQGIGCRGSRVLLTEGNGCLAAGTYRPNADGTFSPWSLQILEVVDGKIIGLNNFIYHELFPYFGLPEVLTD